MKVSIDNLASAVQKELEDYANETSKKTEKIITKNGRKGAKELRKTSPVNRYHARHRGRYRKGWKAKTEKGKFGHVKMTIHNATDYQLTHLLENGFYHVKSNRQVGPFKHIAPVNEKIQNDILNELKEEL